MTDLEQKVNNVSDRLADYSNKAHLIFFAVYGYFKLIDKAIEPKLIAMPLDPQVSDMKISFRQEFRIEIEDESYPILDDAERTILNIVDIRGKNKWREWNCNDL